MKYKNAEYFILPYEYDSTKAILYAPLHSYLALIEVAVADAIIANEDNNYKEKINSLLSTKPHVNVDELKYNINNSPPELSLAINDNCGLRCVYCHASAGEIHKRNEMSKSLIDSILVKYLKFTEQNKDNIIKISFNGGGEPTYNFELLQYAITQARSLALEYNKKCIFSMATNGYYGNDIRNYIVENFHNISLSLDGIENVQNMHRPCKDGSGSFNTVFDTAKYFYERNLSFGFRATVSNYSIKYINQYIDFLSAHFPSSSVSFELLNPFGRGEKCIFSENGGEIYPPEQNVFSQNLISLIEYAKKKKIKVLNSASTEFDTLRTVFCSNVGVPHWTVDTFGKIKACSRDNLPEVFNFGSFDLNTNEILLDNEKLEALKNMSVLNYKECEDCFCKYHCAGDCPDRRLGDQSDCSSIQNIGRHVLATKLKESP